MLITGEKLGKSVVHIYLLYHYFSYRQMQKLIEMLARANVTISTWLWDVNPLWSTLVKTAKKQVCIHFYSCMIPPKFTINPFVHGVKAFRIIPELKILRLTFHRKSASKYIIMQILMASRFNFSLSKDNCHRPYRLSGRVLDSRQRGCEFKPHGRHCVVVLEQDTFILA